MLSYIIPHGSTSNSSCSACSKIPYHWEMQQLYVLQSIPCSPEQFTKYPNTKDTIKFKPDTQEITYTMDMFRAILKLPVETPDNPFVTPITIEIIESFMNKVGYQGVDDKVSAIYMKNLAQPWQTIVDEDYHPITDDTPLVSVYTNGNVLVRGMLISDTFLTKEIRDIDDFKEYETVFVGVYVPMNQPQLVVSTQGIHRSTPRAHRKPTISTASPQGKKRKQTARESIQGHKENPDISDDDDDEEKVVVSEKDVDTIQRVSLTVFPSQSVGSSNTGVLGSPCFLVLIIGTSQSRQHGKSESDSYYLSD
ncbi:hypothetical protein Tco_1173567 [Tanacetum coccineum]